jgi:hypothetical protein
MGIVNAVGRVLMSKLARMYPSVNAIIRAARDLGQTYDYKMMVNDASFFKQAHGLENALVNFDPDRLITKNRMVETRFDRNNAFRVYGSMVVRDLDTGEDSIRPASMYVDFRGSKTDYEQEFISNYEFDRQSKYYGRLQIISFDTDLVVHNHGYSYEQYGGIPEL